MGTGEATNRAFCAVISAPPASSLRRTAPAMKGTTLSAINPAGASHPALPVLPAVPGAVPAVLPAAAAALRVFRPPPGRPPPWGCPVVLVSVMA
ncbi:hypothetical protein Psi01_40180 [Planobispora siamensis]|uniref:Uncharacterized protein n=1 Tax=Planobispora siamensis TaxID=936338 RepID=A0A8J3SPM4_9ACTN|nr:hypothetical protein Psi01_40180 [Planobispora siamensis]